MKSPATISFTVATPTDEPDEFGDQTRVSLGGKVGLSKSGKLTFTLANGSPFEVGANLVAKTASKVKLAATAAKKKKVTLGKKNGTLKPQTTTRLSFKVSKLGRRAIAANKKLRIAITLRLTDPAGTERTVRGKRTLKRPKGFG